MIVEIKNGKPCGLLYIKDPHELLKNPTIVPDRELYNFDYCLWYNPESLNYTIEMRGSIISMMQFRKILSMNYPTLL